MTLLKSPDEIRELWRKNEITAEEMRTMLALQRDISRASGKSQAPADVDLRSRRKAPRLREPPSIKRQEHTTELPQRRMGRPRSDEARRRT